MSTLLSPGLGGARARTHFGKCQEGCILKRAVMGSPILVDASNNWIRYGNATPHACGQGFSMKCSCLRNSQVTMKKGEYMSSP